MGESYYTILGVSENSSLEEIRKQYQNLALQYHPDKLSPDQENDPAVKEKFLRITEAWETLRDPGKRRVYDSILLENALDDNSLKFDSVSYHSLNFVDSSHSTKWSKTSGDAPIAPPDIQATQPSEVPPWHPGSPTPKGCPLGIKEPNPRAAIWHPRCPTPRGGPL
nr:PREDICTED: DPH4 homolog [Bemisia tabaci]